MGDALIYLCACLLPLPYAMAAAAVGGAMADLLTAPMWAPATFLIKALLCLLFSRTSGHLFCRRNVVGSVIAGLLSPTLYGFVNVFFTGSWNAFLPQFAGTLLQGIGSAAVFLILSRGMDLSKVGERLSSGK